MLTLTHAAGPRVKFPYWCILNYAESLRIKNSPILYIANANPNPCSRTQGKISILVHTIV